MNWLKPVLLFAGGILVLLAVLALGALLVIVAGRGYITEQIDDQRRIVAENGVDIREAVEIGGIQQYITIRGHDRDNPVLLYLHGGPGSALLPSAFMFQTPWEDLFTVVQWDQRGSGRTYRLNTEAEMTEGGFTVDRFAQDTCELVDHLRERLGKEKIFVLGHSWGSILGVNAAQRCGDRFHAYIGLGQVVNMVDNWILAYEFTLSEARRRGDDDIVAELEAMGPPPRPGEGGTAAPGAQVNFFDYMRRYGGEFVGRDDGLAHWRHAKLWGPEYELMDAWTVHTVDASFTAPRLWPELMSTDLPSQATEFPCPVIFMLGRWDYNTPSVLAEAYLEVIRAPMKKLIWLENSAHVMVFEEPGRFLAALATEVRPLAEGEERGIYLEPQSHPYVPPASYTDGIRERAAAARLERGIAPLSAQERGFIERAPLEVTRERRLVEAAAAASRTQPVEPDDADPVPEASSSGGGR